MDIWEKIASHLDGVAAGDGAGDADAWSQLLTTLSPELERLARRQPIGRLRDDEDAQRDIVTKVIGKLHRDDHAVIKKLVSHPDPPPLRAWFRVLVRSAAIDVMRGRPEFVRGNQHKAPGWLSLATLVTRDGARVPDSLLAKQREVERFMATAAAEARAALEAHGQDAIEALASEWKVKALHSRRFLKRIDAYERVLSMVLAGHAYVEIAEAIALSSREVELIVGYIEELFHARGFAA